MKARLSRIRLHNLALFVVVAGVVAVAVLIAGRETGVSEQVGGKQADVVEQRAPAQERNNSGEAQSEPLTLTLTTGAKICETGPGYGFSDAISIVDDDGNFVRWESKFAGWWLVEEIPVSWVITGGTGPYLLEIDGETQDAFGPYEGASGTASVTCATTTLERVWERPEEGGRGFVSNPEVDSGPKTIRAVVTDATGQTAEASVTIYVILDVPDSDHVMRRGETYRVHGFLITVPSGYDAQLAGMSEPECSDVPVGERCGPAFGVPTGRR